MTQLPSLGDAVSAARRTLWRFPTVLLAGAVAALAAILQVDEVGPEALRLRLLATATLAIPLLTALTLFRERPDCRLGVLLPLRLAGAAALAWYYLGWPHWSDPVRAERYWSLSAAFHLLVAVLPLARLALPNAFWQFNRALFVRFLAAAIFSATLWAGLALALAAVDNLFGVDVPEEGYFRLWAAMAFVFNTWFFLGGVPEDPAALERRTDYPAALRVFAQYTLVPLVSVYLVILTLYLGKVVVTWDWPSGWIGWLVSGVATTGILALLLVHPAAADPERRWVATFARQFWLAILPPIAMLWMALYQRIAAYGITERRYFLLVLSLWLAALAIYYGARSRRDIRLIPASLCAIALITLLGPWSAYSVSRRSQVGRLQALLSTNGMLPGGTFRPAPREVSDSDRVEISAVLRYLAETHGTTSLRRWLSDSLATVAGIGPPTGMGSRSEAAARRVMTALGIAYVSRGWTSRQGEGFSYSASPTALPLADYDWMVSIREARRTPVVDTGLTALAITDAPLIRILRGGTTLIEVRLDTVLARLSDVPGSRFRAIPQSRLVARAENERARVAVYLSSLTGANRAGTMTATGLGGAALIRLKR